MTEHPITPPRKLVAKWFNEGHHQDYCSASDYAITQAARWGADQELEACCEWIRYTHTDDMTPDALRTARRPKPPSLKEEALALINGCTDPHGDHLDDAALDTIRRALETLPND